MYGHHGPETGYLRRDQDRQLKKLAQAEGRTEAELIRQAVDDLAQSRRRVLIWEKQKQLIETWIRENAANVPRRKRSWTREDLYDRKVFSRH